MATVIKGIWAALRWVLLGLFLWGLANRVFPNGRWFPAPDIQEVAWRWWPYETIALAVLCAARLIVWHRERERFDPKLLDAAVVKRVRDLRVGVGPEGGDVLIPGYRPDVYQPRDVDRLAWETLVHQRAVIVRGRPQSGKTRIAWECLRRTPNAYVVRPSQDRPPAFAAAGLRGREVVLFLDDLHLRNETLDAEQWWHRLKNASGSRCRLIVTVRTGKYWTDVEDKQAALLRAIGRDCIVDASAFRKEEGQALGAQLGMTLEEIDKRWDGTPGALVVDFAEMGREYRRLRDEHIGGVPMCRLLDGAKLLHNARQPVLREPVLRQVCERVLGSGPVSHETWRVLKRRTSEQYFGVVQNGLFGTYRPYLERRDVIDYAPSSAEILSLLDVLAAGDDPVGVFYYGVAAQLDWRLPDNAEAAYRRAVDIDRHPWAAYNLGVLLNQKGDPDGAVAAYRQAIAAGFFLAAHNLGMLLHQRGDLDGAAAAYRQGDAGSANNLGLLLEERGDLGGAEAAFRRAIAGDVGQAANNLGVLLKKKGDFKGAEAAFRQAVAKGAVPAALNLGVLLKERGDLDGAAAAYRQGMDAGDPMAAHNLGLLLHDQGDLHGAEVAYRQALTAGDTTAAYDLGILLHARGDLDGAAAAYRQGMDAGVAQAANNLGVLLQEQGDIPGAEAILRRAVASGVATAAHNLGVLLQGQGDLRGAEEAYRQGMDAGVAQAANNLGGLLRERGDLRGAEQAFRRAIAAGHSWAVYHLAGLLKERSDLKGAEATYRQALAAGITKAALDLGALLKARGDLQGAEEAYRRGMDAGFAEAAVILGRLLKERGDLDGAEEAFRHAAAVGDPEAAHNWELLRIARGDKSGTPDASQGAVQQSGCRRID